MAKRRHSQSCHVGAAPKPVAVNEARAGRILDGRIRASNLITRALEHFKRFLDPAPLGRPVREGLVEPARSFQQIAADRRVERQFHLIDRHAVGRQFQRLLYRGAPVVIGLSQHAGDQVDVDLWEVERAREFVGAENLRRAMGAPVHFEYPIVEALDPKTEARDPHPADSGELGLGQRSRFALESDFLRSLPGNRGRQTLHQAFELERRQKRRRAAPKIDKAQATAGNGRQPGVELEFAREQVEIVADFLGILVRVNAKVAKVAALPAERNVKVNPERHVWFRVCRQRRPRTTQRLIPAHSGRHKTAQMRDASSPRQSEDQSAGAAAKTIGPSSCRVPQPA